MVCLKKAHDELIQRSADDQFAILEELDRLREELTVAREMLDEIQDKLEWAIRNHGDGEHVAFTPRRITSLPLDPCAPDFAERVNRYSAADLPAELCDTTPKQQGQLF